MTSKPQILLIEDDILVTRSLRRLLKREGFELVIAHTGMQGLREAYECALDLVLLDLGLPDMDGMDICKRLKKTDRTEATPILIITGNQTEKAVVNALENGADDYITKPLRSAELVARIRAALRRVHRPVSKCARSGKLEIGPLTLDLDLHEVWIRGRTVQMTTTEFRLLQELASQPGHVISRSELIASCFGRATERSVDVHISSIRRKLGEDRCLIVTVHSAGYKCGASDVVASIA